MMSAKKGLPGMQRRSQVEIVGLMIIVVMISFIILFVFISSLRDNKDDMMKTTTNENLASSMISAILQTSTNCNQYHPNMKEILTECAKYGSSTGISCSGGRDYCTYFRETARLLFSKTIANWQPYEFIVTQPGGDPYNERDRIIHLSSAPNPVADDSSMSVETGMQPLNILGYGNIEIMLCLGGEC